MKMTFTVITIDKHLYTSEIIDDIDDWSTGLKHAITYARTMSETIKEPVKLHSIQRTDTRD